MKVWVYLVHFDAAGIIFDIQTTYKQVVNYIFLKVDNEEVDPVLAKVDNIIRYPLFKDDFVYPNYINSIYRS